MDANNTLHKNGHVLLIEDDELLVALLADTLQQEGYRCTVARTLAEARALLVDDGDFDVIITDLHLPDAGDTPVLDILPGGPGGAPIIVITGTPSLDTVLRSMDLRAYAYRTKPLQMPELMLIVHEAAREARIRQRLGATRERLRTLDEQVGQLRQLTRKGDQPGLEQSLHEYILLLLGNCGENLAEVADAFRLLENGPLQSPVRQLSRHPEIEMYRRATEHAIDVLDKTRHVFKSRELAELRRMLQAALTASQANTPPR